MTKTNETPARKIEVAYLMPRGWKRKIVLESALEKTCAKLEEKGAIEFRFAFVEG